MENFHFGEYGFHRNDSQGKFAAYKESLKVNFNYTDYMDKEEEMYRNIYNITSLKNKLKLKTLVAGDKGSGSNNLEPKI